MMVAFRYDNGAVGALYYSREIPSLLRGLRLSKLLGREGIISFESNGAFVLVRGRGFPRLVFPGFRDIRGYRAMYRDFARSIRDGRAPEMSLERAIEDQRLMDQIYATIGPPGSDAGPWSTDTSGSERSLRRHHHRQRRRRRNDGAGAVGQPGAGPRARARRGRCLRSRKLESGGGLEASALPRDRALARRTRATSSCRTRTTASAATRSSGAACSIGCGARTSRRSSTWTACRRPGRSTTTRSSRTTSVPSGSITCTARAAVDPTEPPRGPFPYAPIPHAPAMAAIVDALRRQGLHPSYLPLGLIRPGEPGGCILCSTCNSFPCRIHAKSDAEVCGIEPALASAERRAVDQRAARSAHRRSGRQEGRGGRGRAERRDASRRRVAGRRVVRRRQLGGAAAAIGQRRASRRPREFVRPRRPALHGAPGDDDAGVPSAAQERHRLSEDRRHQRLLLPRTRTRDTRSATSSRRAARTASWRRPWSLGSAAGRTTPGCRAAWTGWRCPRICRARTTG